MTGLSIRADQGRNPDTLILALQYGSSFASFVHDKTTNVTKTKLYYLDRCNSVRLSCELLWRRRLLCRGTL